MMSNTIIEEKTTTNQDDKKISMAIMSSYAVLTIQYLILIYFQLSNTGSGQIIRLTSKAVVGLFYIIALPSVLKRNRIRFFGIYFIAIFVFLINRLFFNENWIYLKTTIFDLFFTCLPSYIYMYNINNWNILMEVMKKTSRITFVVGTIVGILVLTGNASIGAYSMSLSYYMLLPALMFLNEFFDQTSLKSVVASAISILVILIFGSRGALLCTAVFIVLKLIRRVKNITYKKMIQYFIPFYICILGLFFFENILESAKKILLRLGIISRSISMILESEVYLSSSRAKLYESIIDVISNNPISGIGLAGDRAVLDTYSHNIFLEILSNFGIIIGFLFIFVMMYMIFRTLFYKNLIKYDIAIIWICIGFVPLLVSGSYLTNYHFWILLGLVSQRSNNSINKIITYE